MSSDFQPRAEIERIIHGFFTRGKCPQLWEFKREIVPVLAKNGFDGVEITTMLARFKEEWWRVAVEFDRKWKMYPVQMMSEELEHCA